MAFRVDLFCEDAAHEAFGRALITRCAEEMDAAVTLNVPTARFGIARLKSELAAFQAVLRRTSGTPDLLVVMVDANDAGPAVRRREVAEALDTALFPESVIATPDPYVERWFLADAVSFSDRFGQQPDTGPVTNRNEWKSRLVHALEAAGEVVIQGGAEFADEIVSVMDLYRAGQAVSSLGAFADDLRAALRRLQVAGAAG